MINKIVFLVVLILSVGACASFEFSNELKHIDVLKQELDSLENVYNSINGELARDRAQLINNNLSYVQRHWRDSMDVEIAAIMSQYRMMRKPLNIFHAEFSRAGEEIKLSHEQLTNLHSDLTNGLMDKEKATKSLEDETEAMAVLHASVLKMYTFQTEVEGKFVGIHSKVDSILVEMKRNGMR
jgi:uncharacterized coiled-coil DUF342 family protein